MISHMHASNVLHADVTRVYTTNNLECNKSAQWRKKHWRVPHLISKSTTSKRSSACQSSRFIVHKAGSSTLCTKSSDRSQPSMHIKLCVYKGEVSGGRCCNHGSVHSSEADRFSAPLSDAWTALLQSNKWGTIRASKGRQRPWFSFWIFHNVFNSAFCILFNPFPGTNYASLHFTSNGGGCLIQLMYCCTGHRRFQGSTDSIRNLRSSKKIPTNPG